MSLNSKPPTAQNIRLSSTILRGRGIWKGFNVQDCTIQPRGRTVTSSRAWTRVKPAIAALFLILLPAQAWGGGRHRPSARPEAVTDSGYVLALGIADRFLHAWETGDLETGMVLLSDHVRRTQNAETIEQFFTAGPERGFELMRGSGHKGRYRFPVVLVMRQGNTGRRVSSEIIVVNTGKNDWAVDKLP